LLGITALKVTIREVSDPEEEESKREAELQEKEKGRRFVEGLSPTDWGGTRKSANS